MLKTCIDTNVWISGVLFRGAPATVVTAALNGRFEVVASSIILDELERNLLEKFDFGKKNTRRLVQRILEVADLSEPRDTVKVVRDGHTDNLILETARLGRAKYLVTGDRQHLLPLKSYRMVRIIEPIHFLNLLKKD